MPSKMSFGIFLYQLTSCECVNEYSSERKLLLNNHNTSSVYGVGGGGGGGASPKPGIQNLIFLKNS